MKLILSAVLAVSATIHSCGTASAERTLKAFVPGIYTAHYDGEFSSTVDSIWIKPVAGDGSQFDIVRHRHHDYNGTLKQKGPRQQTDQWVGRLDAQRRVLRIEQNGRLVYLLPERRQLQIGSRSFEKSNP